jgi:hypothetical protein
MTRLEKLESDVAALSAEELAKFRRWFDVFAADQWDAAIETDVRSGALDALGDAALAEFAAGRTRPL